MADPIIAKTLQHAARLRPDGVTSQHEVLATYQNEAGVDVFALCRGGLLLRSEGGWRYVDNAQIEEVGLPIVEVKTSVEGRRLLLRLNDGEEVDVPVDGERDGFLDVFAIYDFVRRRVIQHRALRH